MMFKKLLKKFKEYFHTEEKKQIMRENLQRNLLIREGESKVDSDFINARLQSMKDSQGTSQFSGSGYNGPGNVGHDKVIFNKNRHDFVRT